eukprot:5838094-Alexandrium_andersonii.AAC.1
MGASARMPAAAQASAQRAEPPKTARALSERRPAAERAARLAKSCGLGGLRQVVVARRGFLALGPPCAGVLLVEALRSGATAA